MSLVVLIMYNIKLGSKREKEYVVELSLSNEDLEKIIEKKLQEEMTRPESIKSHTAFNETAKHSIGNPEILKTLDEIIAENDKSKNFFTYDSYFDSNSDYTNSLRELAKKIKEKQQFLVDKKAKRKEKINFSKMNTSVSYSLVNRNNIHLPTPIYTCIEGGKIVINIKVDALGYVLNAVVNKKSSNSLNRCLVENAISYALKARFDTSEKTLQKGKITYLFQKK